MSPLLITAAHELKSPLALMRQLSLSLEIGELSEDEIEKIARQITLTSERALRLTTNLTKTVRLEDSLFTLEPINPVSLCEEVVREVQPLYRAKGREIQLAPRVRPLLAIANKDLLRRILINFADNALHYSDESAPVVVTATSHSNGDKIRLRVRDFGPAIPTKVWQKLDGSFAKESLMSNRPESSGLGIYIATQFAAAMNAEIGATRHRDGASFYVDMYTSTQMRLL